MNKHKYLLLYPLVLSCLLTVYLTLGYFVIPDRFWVAWGDYELADMCTGETEQLVYQKRTPRFFIEAESWDQLVRFDEQTQVETTIYRGSPKHPKEFAYEGGTEARYTIEWDKPINQAGEYGANFNITIYPLPLISLKVSVPATDTRFTVHNCHNK